MYKHSKTGKNLYIEFFSRRLQMNTENMKNMLVLKDLPSNIVDEAIVILKPNVKLKSLDVSIYDYIKKGTVVGAADGTKIYLVFQKNGEYLDYKKYI
mgnify:CR=1 FL=1